MRVWIIFIFIYIFNNYIDLVIPKLTLQKRFFLLKLVTFGNPETKVMLFLQKEVLEYTVIDGYYYYSLVNLYNISSTVPMRIDSSLRVTARYSGQFWGDTCGGNTPYEASIFHLNETDSTIWKIAMGYL